MAILFQFGTTDFTANVERVEDSIPQRVSTESVPRRHGAVVTETPVLDVRRFAFTLSYFGTTRALARTQLDTWLVAFASFALAGRDKLYLDSDRYIWAYYEDAGPVEWIDGNAMQAFRMSVSFVSAEPFFEDGTATSVDQVCSYNPTAWSHTNSGTVLVYPTITILANQGTDVVAPALTNSTTGKTSTYAGTVSSGNSLVIDCANFTVANNGTSDFANFSGTFLWLNAGSNSMSYAGANACTVRIAYNPRYLA